MSATKFPDTTLTAKILADITECHQRVGPTFATCRGQTKMSVVWVVEPTDTNPDIASQAPNSHYFDERQLCNPFRGKSIGYLLRGTIEDCPGATYRVFSEVI